MQQSETKRQLFSEEALERAFAPEQLNGYLKVVRPSAWIAVLALVVFVVGALLWVVFGSYPQILSVKSCLYSENSVISYIPVDEMPVTSLVNCEARITVSDGSIYEGRVTRVSSTPLSQEAIADSLPDAWTAHLLDTSPFAWEVEIEAVAEVAPGSEISGDLEVPGEDGIIIADVTIVSHEERIISILLG
ncbi:MAG: hypothetical protein LBL23_05270 [Coriobacteriales bacterium]|jgi:hypothetical protein|nr:hypothetical protein [Coriobacteriales bacterium]